ncbi:cyclic lactone autoinducer peptide [Fusibacter sp. 3D3]
MKMLLSKMNQIFMVTIFGLALANLNSACMAWSHQPEVPKCLQEVD